MIEFDTIQNILGNLSTIPIPDESFYDDSCERLRVALISMRNGGEVGKLDLMGLVQHFLIRKNLIENQNHELKVPNIIGWPNKNDWNDFGVNVKLEFQGFNYIEVKNSWSPDWLPKSSEFSPLNDSFLEVVKRTYSKIKVDPCISDITHFTEYTTKGQQTALRSIFNSRPGSTILFNLPTGSGKSLISWIPSILYGYEANFTLVIVPTVSLALDQERQFQKLLRKENDFYSVEPCAWYSGRTDEEKQMIKSKIKNGTQKILFTSPESLIGSLTNSIYESVAKGFLKYFIIDEAHLVAQWGDDFRPHFQAIAGIRKDLLKICDDQNQFRTFIMTATLTRETYRVINTLFSNKTDLEIIASVALRPEPNYWIYKVKDFEEKKIKILELIKRCPRPIILYVSKKNDAEFWYSYFKQYHMKRIAIFHGDTKPKDRANIINSWSNNECDLIIATSAFGVGIDKSNVRTVIHACVPETLDRYYQEVGRGGRDGNSSSNFLIYDDNDIKVAQKINHEVIIGDEKGLNRWKKMFANKKPAKEGYIKIDLRQKPHWIFNESDTNQSWNLRTILLMARSDLIEIDSEPPPEIQKNSFESDIEFEFRKNKILNEYFSQCVLKIINTGHDDENVWRVKVERERTLKNEENINSFLYVQNLLSGNWDIAELLQSIYTIPDLNIRPAKICSGCPNCRKNNVSSTIINSPDIISTVKYNSFNSYKVFNNDFGTNFGIITYDTQDRRWQKLVLDLLQKIIARYDIREIAASSDWLENKEYRKLYKYAHNKFLIHSDINELESSTNFMLPRISIFKPLHADKLIPHGLMNLVRPIHLIFIPSDTRDYHPSRLITDTFPYKTLNNLVKGII